MMLNDDVVATMYDKDYSGNNNRYAMFGQSVILDMKAIYIVVFFSDRNFNHFIGRREV